MRRDLEVPDTSELEREFEIEMEEGPDEEAAEDLDREFEGLAEAEEGRDEEFEEIQGEASDYADRLHELSSREFESAAEVDDQLNEILDDMGREYFSFKKVFKKLKKGALGGALGKALGMAKQLALKHPALQALSALAALPKGNLNVLLKQLAKSAIGAAVPGGPMISAALSNLGFKETEAPEENREAWQNFVTVAREAYDHLAANLNARAADDPSEASRLATEAFRAGLRKAPAGATSLGGERRHHRFLLRRGHSITIRCE